LNAYSGGKEKRGPEKRVWKSCKGKKLLENGSEGGWKDKSFSRGKKRKKGGGKKKLVVSGREKQKEGGDGGPSSAGPEAGGGRGRGNNFHEAF